MRSSLEDCAIVYGGLRFDGSHFNEAGVVDSDDESKSCCWDCAGSSVCAQLWIDSWKFNREQHPFDEAHRIQIADFGRMDLEVQEGECTTRMDGFDEK
jgi:hypothetical protein